MTKELVFDSWKGQEFSPKCPGVNTALHSVGTGVKADDPSPFSAKIWVKLYNSTPPYAVMVCTGPTSLCHIYEYILCFKCCMYCMYTHTMRKEFLYKHGYISSHCCENLTYSFICNVALEGSK
jgi:hypothetical protein